MIVALSAGRDAPAELRARVALDEAAVRRLLRARPSGTDELVVLSTCHRTEIYATGTGAGSDVAHELAALLPGLRPTDRQDLRFLETSAAVEHLFRVACGLDSLVVGEPQVLGQVRRALVLAREQGAAGPAMANVFGRAIRLGRRARAETLLGRIGLSIGTLATEHLIHRFETLAGRPGAVVGAGVAATDVARSLSGAGARLAVVSRSADAAGRLAVGVAGTAHPLEDLPEVLAGSDFAVVAVSGGTVVRSEHVPARNPSEPFVVLDLSVPPSVAVRARADVEVRLLEDLPAPRGPEITAAVAQAEALVRSELDALARWIETRASGPVIRELRARAETVVRGELARSLAGMDLTEEEAEKVAALAMRVANKLLHGPTAALRDADEATRKLIQRVFGMEAP